MSYSNLFENCTEVTPQCPVDASSPYGYRPDFAGNTVLLVVFGLCTLGQLFLGLKHKLCAFTFAVTAGSALETIGYGGRLMMNDNPWNDSGFRTQIVCLIIAPSFLAAGFYLTLKHLVIYIGPEYSRLSPKLYTWVFIVADIISIVTQAVGGGIAAGASRSLVDAGSGIIIAGIAIQVATQFICLCLAGDFAVRVWKRGGQQSVRSWSKRFLFYLAASVFAFLTIFIRCVYRLPEMAGGWGNDLMQNELEFLILDGMMIAIACILMTIAHPGIFFPQISSRHGKNTAAMHHDSIDSDEKEETA